MWYCPNPDCIAEQTTKGKVREIIKVAPTFKVLDPGECPYCGTKTKEVTKDSIMVQTSTDLMKGR
jgi:aspartate carbamoyltransferase regulatory subunit